MDPLLIAAGAAAVFFLFGGKDDDGPTEVDDPPPPPPDDGSGLEFELNPNAPGPEPDDGTPGWQKAPQGLGLEDADEESGGGMGFAGPNQAPVPQATPMGQGIQGVPVVPLDQPGGELPILGSFFQSTPQKQIDYIAKNALAFGVYQAYGLIGGIKVPAPGDQYSQSADHDAALALANKSLAGDHYKALMDLIGMSPWNDMVYGSWGVGSGWRNPCGRGFPKLKKYADNRSRILSGDSPARSFPVLDSSYGPGGPRSAIVASPIPGSDGSSLPYLWIPGLDIESLIDISGAFPKLAGPENWTITTYAGRPYGKINPPPAIFERSFMIPEAYLPTVSAQSVPVWGCDEFSLENWI